VKAEWVPIGANKIGHVELRLAPSEGAKKAVIEVRDPTPPARKILINCKAPCCGVDAVRIDLMPLFSLLLLFFDSLFFVFSQHIVGTPHAGMAQCVAKMKSKSLTINLLEKIAVQGVEGKESEIKLNMYRITCDSSAKRDELESALKMLK